MKSAVLLAFVGWLATAGPGLHAQSQAEAPLPATLAGRALAELLMAYHAGEVAAIERFFERRATESAAEQRRRAVERRAAWVANIRRGYRDLHIHRIDRSAEHEIAVLCQSKITQAWCNIELEVDAKPPHGVALGFTYANPPPTLRSERALERADVVRALDAYVGTLVTAGMFSGVVVVATGGKPWFAKAYGRTRSVDAKFSLASMSKMFTAVAMAQLAQQRKLAFTDTIGRHVPDYPRRDVAEHVTIEQLLTHTSGLGDYMDHPAFRAALFVRHRGTPDRIAGHDGENPGVNTLLDMYLERGHTVVVLSDDDPPAARNVASTLETLLLSGRR